MARILAKNGVGGRAVDCVLEARTHHPSPMIHRSRVVLLRKCAWFLGFRLM